VVGALAVFFFVHPQKIEVAPSVTSESSV